MASAAGLFRKVWLVTALLGANHLVCADTDLGVRVDSGRIRPAAPKLRFIEGKAQERLHNGAPVVFALQFTVFSPSKSMVLARAAGRFAVSFDLWEEKFAVTQLGNPNKKSVSHLSAPEAEGWCLDSLSLTSNILSADASFWVRLDVRAEEPDASPAPGEETGMTLARLVELFSRQQTAGEVRLRSDAGPFRLRDLR